MTVACVIDLNSGPEFNLYRKTSILCIVVSLAQSNLFYYEPVPGYFMLRRQRKPAELIKICSSSKDEAREGLSMLTVPRADISGAIR